MEINREMRKEISRKKDRWANEQKGNRTGVRIDKRAI